LRRPRRRVTFLAVDAKAVQDGGKWFGAMVAVPFIGILLYLQAVLGVYILAWILGLIGTIFR
jgi:hypothetical protein